MCTMSQNMQFPARCQEKEKEKKLFNSHPWEILAIKIGVGQ